MKVNLPMLNLNWFCILSNLFIHVCLFFHLLFLVNYYLTWNCFNQSAKPGGGFSLEGIL